MSETWRVEYDGFIFTVTDRPRDTDSDGHRFAMHDTNAAAMLKEYLTSTSQALTVARRALEAQERWEAEMILAAGNRWWDLQTSAQNIALIEAQHLRNAALQEINTLVPDAEVGR